MLVLEYDQIILEDLDVKQMAIDNHWSAKMVADHSISGLRHMIEYKGELYGTTVKVIDRYFPSSQLCSCCGSRTKLSITDRVYSCNTCGNIMDRDLNAAINIERAGTVPQVVSIYVL